MASLSLHHPGQGFQLGPEQAQKGQSRASGTQGGGLRTGNTTFPKETGFILPGLLKEPVEPSPSRARSVPAQEGGPIPTPREGSEGLGLPGPRPAGGFLGPAQVRAAGGSPVPSLAFFISKAKAKLTSWSRWGRGLEDPLLPSSIPPSPAGCGISRCVLTPVCLPLHMRVRACACAHLGKRETESYLVDRGLSGSLGNLGPPPHSPLTH